MARKFRERKARATLSHMAEVWLRLAQRLQQQQQTSAQERQRVSRARRLVRQAVLPTNEGNRIESKQCLELAVRPEGADYQWRKIPLGELSIDPVADERLVRATARAGAS